MISMDEAIMKIISELPTASEIVYVDLKFPELLLGHILAADLKANTDIPPFRASIKDGYAVLASDGDGLRNVIGNSFAGIEPDLLEVKSGHCIRINTGAPLPKNADSVVQVEDTSLEETEVFIIINYNYNLFYFFNTHFQKNGEELKIRIHKKPVFGQDIREAGSDIENGQIVIEKNSMLKPIELG